MILAWLSGCGATSQPVAPASRARVAHRAANPVDAYVGAASARACLERTTNSAAEVTAAFARYLDAHDLAGGGWDDLVARYAERPALAARVEARVRSCEDAAVVTVPATGATVPNLLRQTIADGLGDDDATVHARVIDQLVGKRWIEFTALADPPLLVSGDSARVLVFRAELLVAAREAIDTWTAVSLPAVGVATDLPASWARDARRGYVSGRPRAGSIRHAWIALVRGSHVTPDDLRDEGKRFLAASGGVPAGAWTSTVIGGMAAERFDGHIERDGHWVRVVVAAIRPEIGGVVFFTAVAPARYGAAFDTTFERALAGVRGAPVVNRTGRHERDHSRHERQVGVRISASCSAPASMPVEGAWWKRARRSCPAGSRREQSQDGVACWTRDRKIVGVRVSVYGDGSPSSYTTYCDGIKHGPAIYFGVNGNKSAEGNFDRGEKHGVWRTYYKTGERKDEVGYRAGQFHGEDKYWNRDGELVRVKRWRDGQEDHE